MNERIKDYLGHEEKVLWDGKAESFQAMDKTHKNYYTRRSIIVAVISVAIIAAYFYSAVSSGAGIKWGVVLVLIAIAAFALVSPVLDVRKLRKCCYVLTNEKLILVTPSDVRSVALSSIPTAKMSVDEDGHKSLLCGPDAEKLPACKRRVATLTGALLDQQSSMCDRFVFYAVNDPEGLKKAAHGYLTIA